MTLVGNIRSTTRIAHAKCLRKPLKLPGVSALPKGEAQAYNNRGVVETIHGDYGQAMNYYSRALELRKSLNDLKGLASLYNNIGNILERRGSL